MNLFFARFQLGLYQIPKSEPNKDLESMSGYDLIVKSAHKGPCLPNEERDAVDCLAEYAVSTRLEDLPCEVVEHARHVFLDTLGVIMGGSIEPQASAMAHRLGRQGGGPCTVIGHNLQSSKLNAARSMGPQPPGWILIPDIDHRRENPFCLPPTRRFTSFRLPWRRRKLWVHRALSF